MTAWQTRYCALCVPDKNFQPRPLSKSILSQTFGAITTEYLSVFVKVLMLYSCLSFG